ncbi:PKD domain-containing protein [Georgenia satyanarayanai]|uniref:PKD domain-containing protein n=1 Tax=Georgenia satyanarayanai TaxID=860221 RepID=A0A2Y9A6B3_9MICO|nr:PKD domain-containing protein [Georgenia satyanarayanai]SSA39815.1 PKD domain-containing protein [Georgenia satyanarayanai]
MKAVVMCLGLVVSLAPVGSGQMVGDASASLANTERVTEAARAPRTTPRPEESPRPPGNLRGGTHGTGEVVIDGSVQRRHSRRGSAGDPVAGSGVVRERYCPPVTYVWGKYETRVTACDPVPEGEWAPERWWTDGEDAEQAEEVPREVLVFTREDVQSLLVDSGSLEIQPDQAWVLVGTDTVVMTDAAEHVLGTRVLDLDIDVRVTPVLFTWDFGDGSAPLTGTDPGAPWPNHTVSHVYSDPGTVRISLRTEWDADFRVEGTSTWIPVAGRAVTETQSEPIEVVTARPRLTTG